MRIASLSAVTLIVFACGAPAGRSDTASSDHAIPAAGASVASAAGSAVQGVEPSGTMGSGLGRVPSNAVASGGGGSAAEVAIAQRRTSASAPSAADLPVVRGLYVNRFAAQSRRKMTNLIALADSTEINAFVIDIKDEFGINYRTTDSLVARNAGRAGAIPDMAGLLDTLKAHGIMAIARIVVFKDSVTARVNPAWTIRRADGSSWRDKEGLAWVNPYNRELWDYNIRIAEEVVRLGFEEIQWDYIRFPEPYKSLPEQVFPGADGVGKPEALAGFLREARSRLGRMGIRSTADVFGLVTTVNGALEIGQKWETVAQSADVLLPMVYPSHYPRGAFGVDRPNAEPYRIVHRAIVRAHERNLALGIHGESVRPWLQAFTLGQPEYGAAELLEQKRAVYDAGFDGWVLWHPGSRYDLFLTALEPRLESRKKPFLVVAQDR